MKVGKRGNHATTSTDTDVKLGVNGWRKQAPENKKKNDTKLA